ncbi:MAG: mitochondrial fission ELM1 family protein [Nitrospirota bacterium]|nr:mitochondrial fission ELM1 family protein [Nitrospirota bacterium]
MKQNRPDCWVLTDGRASMRNQCLGLAEALGMEAIHKRADPKGLHRILPPGLWPPSLATQGKNGDVLAPPWPRLLIACGQNTVHLSIAVRRASRGQTFTVQLESPGVSPRHFDLVVPPLHDGLTGRNVVPTTGTMHRVTESRLAEARIHFAPNYATLPRPLVGVLVGGDSRRFKLTEAVAKALAAGLKTMVAAGAGLLITTSRRTGPKAEAILRAAFGPDDPVAFWDGEGENPYYGYLALADMLVVTCDSVMMLCEAVATGKPVQMVTLEGGGGKFARFHQALMEHGAVRPFDGTLAGWKYAPINDVLRVAAEVRTRLESRGLVASG